MTSAALPTLPSIRAKELETVSHATDNDESRPEDTVNLPVESSSGRSDSIPSASLRSSSPSNDLSQSETQRSEHLATLHQKEQKVFSGLPPLESSVACNAIHQYISATSSFLNSFIADANASHEGVDHKLTVLEKQMALLESKIASMPDLFPEPEEKEGDHGDEAGASKNREECEIEVGDSGETESI